MTDIRIEALARAGLDEPTDSAPPSALRRGRIGRGGHKRLPWRELLRRVFSLDALVCTQCLGPMTVIAYITEAVVVTKVLKHLGLPSERPALSPARGPAQLELLDQGWGSAVRLGAEARRPRAPPGSTGGGFVVELDDLPEPEDDWGA